MRLPYTFKYLSPIREVLSFQDVEMKEVTNLSENFEMGQNMDELPSVVKVNEKDMMDNSK
jgi:hypothetical protein